MFIDASFWIARFYPRDQDHSLAERWWRRLIRENWNAVTTNWTLYEALTFLNSRRVRRHDLALDVMDAAYRHASVVDAAQYERQALDVFRARVDKRWSVEDCASFVCIRERGAVWALSFDRDFAQAQYEFNFTTLRMGDDSR